MRQIKLSDGSVYPVSLCGAASGLLHIVLSEMSVLTAATTFSDPGKTARIEHYFEGSGADYVQYEGYTVLTSVSVADSGTLVVLRRDNA